MGLLTYLGSFIPNLSQIAAILRDLLKKDVPFEWSENHQEAFAKLKRAITKEACIAYYDAKQPVALEVDASLKVLGAVLVQEDRLIAFASKTLTKTQCNYSNIEREMLALEHGVERFHTYLHGRDFTIITNHKLLEMICNKPIIAAPPRLQRMLLRIQGYDYTVKYRPGKEMVISDDLSRLPNPKERTEVKLDVRVDGLSIDLIDFSPLKQQELKRKICDNPVLNALAEVIYQGWPEKIKDLPTDLRSYWSYRDQLGIEDGVIFKGRQVVTPETSKTPSEAWRILGTDLFEIKGKQYIILSDYYSKYPIVKQLQNPITSAAVTEVVEEACSMFGRPDQIRSDNGPQYASEHFKSFCREWGIEHMTSSPHYAQSNGYIERQIRWVKPIIKKCLKTSQNVNLALLNIRATPVDSKLPSPAELLMKRQIATILPSHPHEIRDDNIKRRLEEHLRRGKSTTTKMPEKTIYHHYIQDNQSGYWTSQQKHGVPAQSYANAQNQGPTK